ncbi:MAG: A/G-specific adenine glycosylase [Elusimicrobia bacterium]|nr:A/G-specific adenine glycosylase [Elusimicrobiota bacterium]
MKKALLDWYRRRRRDLPWRRRVSPYRTWVSEIMLQQTTVAAVVPKYERFLERFPDLKALAAASEDEVLRAWSGLGYYSRARNLLRAAQKIVSEHGGEFPSDFDSILGLPGIGRYTAGAILSIAFGKAYPVLDGNVMRVFARYFGIRKDLKKAETKKQLWASAEKLVDRGQPGDWNQALMELGATVCLPESPDCGACPVSRDCAAFRKNWQDELPVSPKRRDFIELKWTCLWIEDAGKVLLWKRSAQERFLKGHWGLPEPRHLRVKPGRLLRKERHTITHHKIAIEVRAAQSPKTFPKEAVWVPKDRISERLVSSLWLKCLGS